MFEGTWGHKCLWKYICMLTKPDRSCRCHWTYSEVTSKSIRKPTSIKTHYNSRTTQKIPVRHTNSSFHNNARFDTQMPYPACISCHCHYQTHTLPLRNIFSNFIKIFLTPREMKMKMYWYIQIYIILWNMTYNYSGSLTHCEQHQHLTLKCPRYFWYFE